MIFPQSKNAANEAEEDQLLESILEFTENVGTESSEAAKSKVSKDKSTEPIKKVEYSIFERLFRIILTLTTFMSNIYRF